MADTLPESNLALSSLSFSTLGLAFTSQMAIFSENAPCRANFGHAVYIIHRIQIIHNRGDGFDREAGKILGEEE